MLRNCLIVLLGIVVSHGAVSAEQKKTCSREAMNVLNDRSPIRIYTDYFIKKQDYDVVNEIEAISVSTEFTNKYAIEIERLQNDHKYKPSEAFCHAAYIEVDMVHSIAKDIATKHGYSKK